ncbi:MAG: Uma2 family endonuclease, partial [Cytophagales bacterium]|nr:Uma2 family endonuclease [Cytophagales bacterium]
PHTSKKDLNDKYQIYEENGVKEYWVVYPGEEYIEVYTLANDKYVRHDVYANDETLQSVLFPNLKIDIKEVFEA